MKRKSRNSEAQSNVGHAGDNLAAQMIDQGVRAFRTTDQGKSRGLFCGMGLCGECRVHIKGQGTVRACMSAEPYSPAVSMHRPSLLADLPAPIKGGDTSVNLAPDVLIIGAGPAGLSAARTCAQNGLSVTIVDERLSAGGQFYKQPANAFFARSKSPPDRQSRQGGALIDEVKALGITILNQALVWAVEQGNICHVTIEGRSKAFSPKVLVLATGAFEKPHPFDGWTEPGVMTTGAIQTMLRSYGVLTGKRVVVAGNGPLNFQVAVEAQKAGAKVVAIAETAPITSPARIAKMLRAGISAPKLLLKGAYYMATLKAKGVPILTSSAVSSVQTKGDELRVGVTDLRSGLEVGSFQADVVGLGYGFIPTTEISRLLGCHHEVGDDGILAVARNDTFETSAPNAYQIGDCAGLEGAFAALAQGQIAGTAIVAKLTGRVLTETGAQKALLRHRQFQHFMWGAFLAPSVTATFVTESTTICRCEEVKYKDVHPLIESGVSLSSIKKATRCGMGACQGRYCGDVLRELRRDVGFPVSERTSYWAPRIPVRPVPVAALSQDEQEAAQ